MCIAKLLGRYNPSAKVVDNTLILSLPGADTPVVWRMGLGFVRASAIEVRDNPGGDATLTLKTPEKEHFEIADFTHRGDAIHALLALTKAMENAPSQQIQTTPIQKTKKRRNRWIMPCLFIILFIFGLYYLWSLITTSGARDAQSILNAPAKPIDLPTTQRGGAAISADDFLRGR